MVLQSEAAFLIHPNMTTHHRTGTRRLAEALKLPLYTLRM
jgi:hypothetical protein